MSMRYKGGIISATPPVTTTSKGIWTLTQQMQAAGGSVWPTLSDAPTIGTATAGNVSASVAFTVPVNQGYAPPVTYTATSSPGSITGTGSSTPVTVSGLTNGTAYTFTVTATNTAGTSAASAASNSVTPSDPVWIAKLATSGAAEEIAVDSSGNVYVVGTGGYAAITLAKYDSSGVIQWQRNLSETKAYGFSVALDSSNNIYVCGASGASFATVDMIIVKYDNSGTVQWQRKLAGAGTDADEAYSIVLDSSDNVYITGLLYDTFGNRDIFIAKYNSSGTIQWQRKLAGGFDVGHSIAVDSSSNVYIGGQSNNAGSAAVQIAKYNSSGTIQFQKRITLGPYSNMIGYGIAVDSSQNIYIAGEITLSTADIYVAKLDSTASTITWDKLLYSSSGSDTGRDVAVDSSGNVYITGNSFQGTGPQSACQVVKYNSSGTIQWQRFIERTSGGTNIGWGIKVDANNNYYVSGTIGSGDNFLIGKLPVDGTKTGTYTLGGQTIQYSASSMTNTGVGQTTATSTLTDSAASMTGSTPSLTASTPTYTASVVTL